MPRRETPDPLALRVGTRIRGLRKERGLSLERLSVEASVGKGFLSEIEQGLAIPSLTTLARLAKALDLELYELLVFETRKRARKRTRHR